MGGWEWTGLILSLVGIDLVVLLAWVLIDPLQRQVEIFPIVKPSRDDINDENIRPILQHCRSERFPLPPPPSGWTGIGVFGGRTCGSG